MSLFRGEHYPPVALDTAPSQSHSFTNAVVGGGDYRVARGAPYGNDHTARTDCKIVSGKLIHHTLLIPAQDTISTSHPKIHDGGVDRPSLTPHPSDPFSPAEEQRYSLRNSHQQNGNYYNAPVSVNGIDYNSQVGEQTVRSQLNGNYFVSQQTLTNPLGNSAQFNNSFNNNNNSNTWQSQQLLNTYASPTNLQSHDYQLPLHLQTHGRHQLNSPYSQQQQPPTLYQQPGAIPAAGPTGNQFYIDPLTGVPLDGNSPEHSVGAGNYSMTQYSTTLQDSSGHYSQPHGFATANQASPVFSRQAVLPAIPPQTPPITIADLLIGNKNITDQEELELLQDLRVALGSTETEKLSLLKEELTDYDPYFTGCIDASTVHRTCGKHFRGINIPQKVLQQLFKLFAQNPQKPRLIRYEKMVQYLQKIIEFNSNQGSHSSDRIGIKSPGSHLSRSVTAQSPSYARGDAKLILEIEECLRDSRLTPLDVEDVRQSLAGLDRLRRSTLTRKQIEEVLTQHDLSGYLAPVMDSLMDRCDKGNGEYDWLMFVRFVEKGQPQAMQSRSQSVVGARSGLNGISFHTHNGLPMDQKHPRHHTGTRSFANNIMFHGGGNPNDTSNHDQLTTLQSSKSAGDLRNRSRPGPEAQLSNSAGPPASRPQRSMDPMVEVIEDRLQKQTELSDVERQLDQLRIRRSQIRAGLEADARRMEGQEKVASLVEALHRMDHNKSGSVPIGRAYQIIVSSNELYLLGLSDKFIRSIVDLCADDDEKFVSLDLLAKYLRKSLAIAKI